MCVHDSRISKQTNFFAKFLQNVCISFPHLHIVFASPFFLKEVDENYPKKIFPKTMEDNNCDVLEIRRKSNQLLPKLKLMVLTIEFMFYFFWNALTQLQKSLQIMSLKTKNFILQKNLRIQQVLLFQQRCSIWVWYHIILQKL